MSRSRCNALDVRRGRRVSSLAAATLVATVGLIYSTAVAAVATGRPSTLLVATKDAAPVGPYLVAANGYTLYTFALDTKSRSACNGVCAKLWPPVLVKKGTALSRIEHGLKSSRLGEIKRSNGTLQLTYEGRPLYRFAGDKAPGQRRGQGFEHVWSVALVTPAPTTPSAATAPTSAPAAPPSSTPTTSAPVSSSSSGSPPPTSPPVTSPPPTTPPTTAPPTPTTPPTTQPPGGGYGY
jgi:predicted lipoprotein with Yx(FWY)xxD motif